MVWTFLTSLKGPTTIFEVSIRYVPSPPDLANYRDIFGLERFRWALLNSTIHDSVTVTHRTDPSLRSG